MEQESKSGFAVVKLKAQKPSGTEPGCISAPVERKKINPQTIEALSIKLKPHQTIYYFEEDGPVKKITSHKM